MSRTHKAAVLAAFTYVQFALAIVTGIILVPLVLSHLGARTYGLWLTTGELVAYASMVELGVLGVMPWMLAEADGSRDRAALGRLVSNGLTVGCLVGVGFAAIAVVLWSVLPSMLWLTSNDRASVSPALAVMVVAIALTYPLRVYRAVLSGLQDVVFTGALGIVEAAITAAVTITMLMKGYGVYALGCAAAASTVFGSVAATARVAYIAPDLVWQWQRPTAAEVRALFRNGIGVWFGMFGWQIIAASSSIVITYIGHPEWVPVYACTAKLSAMSMQLGWILPDSGLIGLAQLHGEHPGSRRLAHRIEALLRLHLLLAGAGACGVLAFNPAFVTRWVGAAFFAGSSLNALLAVGIVASSLVHGYLTVAAVLGRRLPVGVITLGNAGLQLVCAVVLGHRLGLLGIAAAGPLSTALISLPAGIHLLRMSGAVTIQEFFRDSILPWLIRVVPLATAASLVGIFHASMGIWSAGLLSALLGAAYVWHMRPLYHVLPVDPRWARWLVSLRLLPPMSAATPMEQL